MNKILKIISVLVLLSIIITLSIIIIKDSNKKLDTEEVKKESSTKKTDGKFEEVLTPTARGAKYSVPGSNKFFVCYALESDEDSEYIKSNVDSASNGLDYYYLYHPSKKELCLGDNMELPTYGKENEIDLVDLLYINTDYLTGEDPDLENKNSRIPFMPYRDKGELFIYDIKKDLIAKVELDKDIYYGYTLLYHGDNVLDGIILESKKDYGEYYYSFVDNKIKFMGSYIEYLGGKYLYAENGYDYWVINLEYNKIVYEGRLEEYNPNNGRDEYEQKSASRSKVQRDLFAQIRDYNNIIEGKVLSNKLIFNDSVDKGELFGRVDIEEEDDYTDIVTKYGKYVSKEDKYYDFGQYGGGFDLRLMYLFINGKDVGGEITDDNVYEVNRYDDIIVVEADSEATCGYDPGTFYIFNTKGDLLIKTSQINMLTYKEDSNGFDNPFLIDIDKYNYEKNVLTISYNYNYDDEYDGASWNEYNTCSEPDGISDKQFCKKIKSGKAYKDMKITYTFKNGKIANKKIIPGKKVIDDKNFKKMCN